MSFPRYSEYQASGIPWVEFIPAAWKVLPLYAIAKECDDSNRGMQEKNLLSLSYGRIVQKDINSNDGLLPESFETYQIVQPNDIVLRLTDLQNDQRSLRSALVRQTGIITSAYLAVRPQGVVPHFLSYLLRAYDTTKVFYSMGGGLRQSMKFADLKRLPMVLPTEQEQGRIASFLDHETAKIDALVAEQEKLITLLQEKRQAVISHAVTKGLNPNAPMRDSGVEWLGEVPAHWEVRRVKDYFQTCSGGTPNTGQQALYYTDEENGIPWVRTTDLQNDILRNVEVFITEQALIDTACSILPKGTVMVAMYGGDGTVGKNGLLAIAAAINQAVCGLLPANTHSPEYTFRFMQFYRPHWMIGAESSRKDPNISQERVRNAPFLRPPIEEQKDIVTFLDHQLCAFDTLMAEARTAITLLQERRTALISAAVTGQIDVRNWSPQEGA